MKIRKANTTDAKRLMSLLNEAPELAGGIEKETYSENWVNDSLNDTERNLTLIAEENSRIIGFLIAEIWKGKKNSFLVDIFVVPEYRKKGVATEIIKEYETICRKLGINVVVMLTLITNKIMQGFIEKEGYVRGNKFYFYEKKSK